jgi:arylsulfatase A-like enzyme
MASTPPTIMVLTIFDDVHPSGFGPYNVSTATHPETSPDDWLTPELVDMAAAGIRLNNFRTEMVCSPTRAEIHGYGAVGRASNLTGKATSVLIPAGVGIDVTAAGGANLVRTFKKLGYTVAGFGKLHMSNEQPVNFGKDTWAKQMGFDYYGAMMQSNPGKSAGCGSTIRPDLASTAWSHNWWCEYAFDGTYKITGDGDSADDASNGYANQVIFDAAEAYIDLAIADSPNKYLIIINFSGPHSPWGDGNDTTADYTETGEPFEGVDDRIPGSSVSNDVSGTNSAVYGEQLIHVDGLLGQINDLLDFVSAEHMHIVVGDNGVPNNAAGALCDGSRGRKGSPYPCGTNTPFVIQGTALGAAGVEIDALFGAVDLPKTMARLAGGNHGRRDGISFADCLTYENSKTAANCVGNDVLVSNEWAPLGGNGLGPTYAAGANPAAPTIGDTALDWDRRELGAISDACGSKTFLLHRTYDMSVELDPFCEVMYEITSGDPYISVAGAVDNLVDSTTCDTGSYAGELDQTVMDADETCAYLIMRDAIQARATVTTPAPFLSGGSM